MRRCAVELDAADADVRVYDLPRPPIAEVTDRSVTLRREPAAPIKGAELGQTVACRICRFTFFFLPGGSAKGKSAT